MKGNFIFPKIILLITLSVLLWQKFDRANSDLKAGEQVKIENAKHYPAPVAYAQAYQDDLVSTDQIETEVTEVQEKQGLLGFIKENLGALLFAFLALAEAITRLTPTDKDNSVVNFIKKLLDMLIPNRRTGSGLH